MPALPKIGVEAVVDNSDGYLKAIKAIQSANDQAAQSVTNTAKKFDVLNDTTDYAKSVQNRYTESLKDARAGLESTAPAADHMAEAIAAASLAVSAASAVFNAVGRVLSFVGDIIGDVIRRAADLGKHIFESGMTFSKTMANISAVTKITGTDLRDLGKDLIAIGEDSVAGPQAVADAYYDVASGITDSSLAMYVLKDAIATAEAGQADLKATTNGLISVVNAYSGGVTEAAYFSDVFTQTVNKGKGTMDEFVAALSPLAATSANLGVNFDELGGAMSFMTQKGLTAGQAGAALQGIMAQLSRNTPGVTKALKAMGEQSVESSLANNGLAGTLNLLIAGAKKTGQNLQTLVGRVEAMKAVTILGADEFKNYFKTFMEGVDEATSKAREIQRLDVSAQLQLISARFEGIGLSISQAVLPAFGKFLKFINDSFKKIDWKKIGEGLDKVGEKLGESVGTLVDQLGSALENVDWDQVATTITNAFSSIADFIGNIDWAAVITGAQSFFSTIIQVGQGIFNFFSTAIQTATQFSGSWTAFWAQVGFAVSTAVTNVQNFISGALAPIQGAVQSIIDAITPIWNNLFGSAGTFSSAVNTAFTQVQTFISNALAPIQSALQPLIDAVTNLWNSLFGEGGLVPTAVSTAFSLVQSNIDNALAPVKGAVQGIITAVETIWNGLFGEGGSLVGPIQAAWKSVQDKVEIAKAGVTKVFNAIATAISNALQPALDFINGIAAAVTGISNAIKGMPGGGGGGGPAGGAHGGTLQEGLNIVGENGAEAIVKHGNKAVVVSHERSAGLLSKVSTVGLPDSGGNALTQALSMLKSANFGNMIPVPVAVPAMSSIQPAARPLAISSGDSSSSSSVTTNHNVGNINFNMNRPESSYEKFARMRITKRF